MLDCCSVSQCVGAGCLCGLVHRGERIGDQECWTAAAFLGVLVQDVSVIWYTEASA